MMTTNVPFDREKDSERFFFLSNFEEAHREEIGAITRVVAKITSLSPEEITPHVYTMLSELVKPKNRPFHETVRGTKPPFDRKEWEAEMKALAAQGATMPVLPDEAFTRGSIYENHD